VGEGVIKGMAPHVWTSEFYWNGIM